MEEILTEELLNELLESESVEDCANNAAIPNRSLSLFLGELLEAHNLKKADVIRESGLNPTFAYEIFNGTKTRPSRNKVLQLAFGMKLSLSETQRLLAHANVGSLYAKNRRDAIILYCIDKSYSLHATDDELFRFGQETVSDS